MRTTFTWRGITFDVRITPTGPVYRDAAHLGGPWTNATKSIGNSGLEPTFRRALRTAVALLG